jgi:nicotinamide riboside kinase
VTSPWPDILRVGLVGPESSGKTTLAGHLYAWLVDRGVPTTLVPEQGRVLAGDLPPDHPWSFREQVTASRMHTAAEARASTILHATYGAGVVLLDGTNATQAVWHLCALDLRPGYDGGPAAVTRDLLDAVVGYDLTLLLAPDLPWVADGIRDDPRGRDHAFTVYRRVCPDAVVVAGAQRVEAGIRRLAQLLQVRGSTPEV